MKKKNKVKIEIISDNSLIVPDHIIEFQNKSKKIIEKVESLTILKKLEISKDDVDNIIIKNNKKKIQEEKILQKKIL